MPTFGPSTIRAVSDHRPQLDLVLRLVHDVLGAEVAGVFLHGSAVLGGLRPDSDLDVFVVARRRMTDHERRNLLHGLLGISGRGARNGEPGRPVELIVVAQGDVRPWRYPPRCEFLYGEWPVASKDMAALGRSTVSRTGTGPYWPVRALSISVAGTASRPLRTLRIPEASRGTVRCRRSARMSMSLFARSSN